MNWYSLRLCVNHKTDFPTAACGSNFIILSKLAALLNSTGGMALTSWAVPYFFLIALKRRWELPGIGCYKIDNLGNGIKVSEPYFILFYSVYF